MTDLRQELFRLGIENFDLGVKIMKLQGRMGHDEPVAEDDEPLMEDAIEEPERSVVP